MNDSNLFNKGVFSQYYQNVPIPKYDVTKLQEQFKKNSLLFAIMDFKAKKSSQVKPQIVKTVNQADAKEFKKWNSKVADPYERKQLNKLRLKAFEEIELDEITVSDDLYKLKKILTQPNEYQTFGQFLYAFSCFMDLSGWSAQYNDIMENGINKGKYQNIYELPSNHIEIVAGGIGEPIKEYRMLYGFRQTYPAEYVTRLSSFSFDYNGTGGHLYGTSKVQAAWDELETYNKGKEREYSSFDGGDLRAILMPKLEGLNVDSYEGGTITEKFMKFRDSILRSLKQIGRQKVAIVDQQLDVIQMINKLENNVTKDAKAEVKANVSSVWHMHPDYVFGSSESSTYDNMKMYVSASLRDGVFPDIQMKFEALNEYVINNFNGYGLIPDFDVFPELTLDRSTEMERLAKVDFMSDNEKREWMDYSKIEDERAELPSKYWDVAPNFEIDAI